MKINCFSVNKVKITQEFFYQVPWKPGQCAQVSKLDVLTLVYFKYMDFIQLESAELTEIKSGLNHSQLTYTSWHSN